MPVLEAPPRSRTPILSRRRFLTASVTAAAGLALYSNDIARHELQITEPTFYIRNLPPAFEGYRLIQISDLHLEEYTEDYFLEHVINRVNRLEADMVLVTGDFISRGPLSNRVSFSAAGRCAELLSRLKCPVRYGILGNHDAAVGSRAVSDHMAANGLTVLINQSVRIEHGGDHIVLAGLDDVTYGYPDLQAAVPQKPGAPLIVMVHEPDYARWMVKQARGKDVDYILSGHTHGGQIRLPGLRPLSLPPNGKFYPEGHFNVGSAQLYVNRGIGTVGVPFRLNCPPEITLATLRTMPSSSSVG
jgi:predicted MPP superfamily phosphohydrolase